MSKEEIEPPQNHDKLAKEIHVIKTGFLLTAKETANFVELCDYGLVNTSIFSTILKTSTRVSPGFPNTKNSVMKARGRRPSAFIVFEWLKLPLCIFGDLINLYKQKKSEIN